MFPQFVAVVIFPVTETDNDGNGEYENALVSVDGQNTTLKNSFYQPCRLTEEN